MSTVYIMHDNTINKYTLAAAYMNLILLLTIQVVRKTKFNLSSGNIWVSAARA